MNDDKGCASRSYPSNVRVYEDICPACEYPKQWANEPCEMCKHDPQAGKPKSDEDDDDDTVDHVPKREIGQCTACKEPIPLDGTTAEMTHSGICFECPACYCLHDRKQFALIWEEKINAAASHEGEPQPHARDGDSGEGSVGNENGN